jgi:hypothetical protein
MIIHPVKTEQIAEQVKAKVRLAFGGSLRGQPVPVDNPVSLDSSNIWRLRDVPYLCSYKADGVRFVLVLCFALEQPVAAMVDRSGAVFALHVDAPFAHYRRGSVFDGELCIRKVDSAEVYDFLVFNCLTDRGTSLRRCDTERRLHHVTKCFSPETLTGRERQNAPHLIHAVNPRLNFLVKEHVDLNDFRSMLRLNTPQFPHDGFVFTPKRYLVSPGRSEEVLKLKSDNTIDVVIAVHPHELRFDWLVDNGGELVVLDQVVHPLKLTLASDDRLHSMLAGHAALIDVLPGLKPFNHIIEFSCTVMPEQQRLHMRYVRIRTDKDGPNNVVTVLRTLRTIEDGIDEDAVLRLIEECKKKETPPKAFNSADE